MAFKTGLLYKKNTPWRAKVKSVTAAMRFYGKMQRFFQAALNDILHAGRFQKSFYQRTIPAKQYFTNNYV